MHAIRSLRLFVDVSRSLELSLYPKQTSEMFIFTLQLLRIGYITWVRDIQALTF